MMGFVAVCVRDRHGKMLRFTPGPFYGSQVFGCEGKTRNWQKQTKVWSELHNYTKLQIMLLFLLELYWFLFQVWQEQVFRWFFFTTDNCVTSLHKSFLKKASFCGIGDLCLRNKCLFLRHKCLFLRHMGIFLRHMGLFLRHKRFFLPRSFKLKIYDLVGSL